MLAEALVDLLGQLPLGGQPPLLLAEARVGLVVQVQAQLLARLRQVHLRVEFHAAAGYGDALRGELSQTGVSVHMIYPGSVATNVSRNAMTADGSKRGVSDKVRDEGIPAPDAAKTMLDGIAKGEREIIVAEGMELAMGEARRTPDQLFDQVAAMVASGYMEKMEEGA